MWPFQRIRNAPRRFRVTLGLENVRFSADTYTDIIYLDAVSYFTLLTLPPVFRLHGFSQKAQLKQIGEAIIICWSSVYTEFPHCVWVGWRTQFQNLFAELVWIHDVEIKKNGIQSPNSLGFGEQYHHPPDDSCRTLKMDHLSFQRQFFLALAVKAMNNKLEPEVVYHLHF